MSEKGFVFAKIKNKIRTHYENRNHPAIVRSKAGNVFLFIILFAMAAFMLLPFIYAVMQSLKPMEEIFIFPPKFFVRNPSFENYRSLGMVAESLSVPFSRYIFNSVFITAVGTVATVLLSSMAAFPFAKYKFPGSGVMFKMITMALLFVGTVSSVPQYLIMAKTGMVNTYWALLGPAVASPLGLFLLTNFMSQISNSIIEAASLDGAGILSTWWRVVMPNVRPAILTLIILCFQSLWSLTGTTFIYDEKLKMLPTILNQISSSGISRAGAAAAAGVIMVIPPILFFIVTQSRVIETYSFAGIKE